MLYALLVLLAQEGQKAAEQQGEPPGPLDIFKNPMTLLLLMGAMYLFIVVLPGARRDKKQRESMLANLKKNDEVITSAGIIGVVTNLKEGADEVTLRIDDNAKIRVLKSTIVKIIPRESTPGS